MCISYALVPLMVVCVRVRTYRRGLRVVGSIILGNARASKGGTTTVGLHAFYFMPILDLIISIVGVPMQNNLSKNDKF